MKTTSIKLKRTIMITMCTLICIMAVGYAAFSTNLKINGTASIESTWKIEFTDITEVSKTSGVKVTNTPTASGTTATFNVDLTSPGDKIVYQITVANKGTIDAIINAITASETGSDAIKFEITGIKKGDKLAKSKTSTFNVTISYDSNVTTQPKTTNNTLVIDINYIQDTGQVISSEDVVIDKNSVIKVNGNIDEIGTDIQIGNEHFYVISSDDIKVAALAKYNLDIDVNDVSSTSSKAQDKNSSDDYNSNHFKMTPLAGGPVSDSDEGGNKTYKGTGIQNEYLYGGESSEYATIAFSSTYYWSCEKCDVYNSNSKLYRYIESYKLYLKSKGAEILNARLITRAEYTTLGCQEDGNCNNAPSWVYSSSYWTSAVDRSNFVLGIGQAGSIRSTYDEEKIFGVRPVIEILKSDI